MKTKKIEEGLYGFELKGRRFRFNFLSENSFHIQEEGKRTSRLETIDEEIIIDIEAREIQGGVEFCYRNLKVSVFDSGEITISNSAKKTWKVRIDEGFNFINEDDISALEGQRQNGGFSCLGTIKIENDSPVYGLGERSGPLDKRGYRYINWNTDDPSAHVDTFPSLYQSLPFFICHNDNDDLALFFNNASRTYFDINKADPRFIEIGYELGLIDLYFFLGEIDEVIASFTELSGRSKLSPYWALGAQQCRWSYFNKEEVEGVIDGYEKADIPLSVVYLDIDYMDSYKDFTVDPSKYPDIVSWIASLHGRGLRIVPIIDAGVKAEEGYFAYDEGMENGYFSTLDGEVYHNEVWPGDSVFPAFYNEKTRDWWSKKIADFLNLGFDGIWNDMNEPASFKGPLPLDVDMGGLPHAYVHNMYGHYMCQAGAKGFELINKRLFQLTRAGFAGTNAYSHTWAGDNQSIYDHLRLMFPELANMSLSGQAYVGVDIGGFSGDTTDELLAKWAIAAIFNPLYRNHSALNTKYQEPYLLNGVYLEAYKKAVRMRYTLLPTLYDELFAAEVLGTIALRPLIYNYPHDERVKNENTEIMLGRDFLLAPSLIAGESMRSVYFPDEFVDLSGKAYGKGHHLIDVSLPNIPLFFRKDGLAVISRSRKAEMPDALHLLIGEGDAMTIHFEDDGHSRDYESGVYNLYRIEKAEDALTITPIQQGYASLYKSLIISVPGKEDREFPFDPHIVTSIKL